MKKIIFSVAVCLSFVTAIAQTTSTNKISVMERNLNDIQVKQTEFDKKLQQLTIASYKNKRDIQTLEQRNEVLNESIDSLKNVCDSLQKAQTTDRTTINGKIQETNKTLSSTQSIVENRTLYGGIIIAIILFTLSLFSYYLTKRIKHGTSSIDEMRKAQDTLQKAHAKMQEESIKLDNKMIELCEQQIQSVPSNKIENTSTDHSLALKVADEITRIELNLSRMDASIKGYKQLSKAVQRIKDNFSANGYEIVDMLGKPYNAGMKAAVTFVTDDNLEKGKQIITKVIKPQINYKQQMIQAAQIEVSQSE